ncbi:MAG: integrase family protein [Rhizobiales bacterium]|nr:integrase family protein [Hyphomicrobiales bacterium]MBO6697870.1 integrase family protein [Hyphomicrobiales bacterium]MBO6735876.1 integrase family protein [Hyphomicrobiales bacterium]MBO6913887.1 integrase family protein [Hyphomicrobiales bacterium]MBO6955590.1 integrase family protein [Hyphomicrobiales bacterium]
MYIFFKGDLHEVPKLYLNDTFVGSAICPAGKDQELFWDSPLSLDGKVRGGAIPGLGLRVTVQGHKCFVHSFEWGGKRRRIKLGDPANMNVASARLLVSQRKAQLTNGENPDLKSLGYSDDKPLTLSRIIDQFWVANSGGWSESHRYSMASLLCRRLRRSRVSARKACRHASYRDLDSVLGDYVATKIKPADISSYLSQFTGAATHNRAYSSAKSLFNWAIRMQLVDMRNPCDPLSLRKSIRQRRDYSSTEIQAIARHIFQPQFDPLPAVIGTGTEKRLTALAHGRELVSQKQMQELCHFMGILFLTMARPKELREAEFSHFDLERLIWHKHNTKGIKLSRQPYEYAFRSIPIHRRVADIVRAQRQLYPGSRFVFPSQTDATQPRDNFKRQLAKFKQLDGVPEHFQLYDLKRIAISLMLVGQGVRREDVSHYVDHRGNLATTMIYDLGFVDPMRPVTDRLGELLGV